jgi:hypothetical protein
MVTKRTATAEPTLNGKDGEATTRQGVVIAAIEPGLLDVEIVGTTPLLVCCWSKKARDQMLAKQMKKANRGKEAKDPQADYEASRYKAVDEDGAYLWDGVPAGGVKGCLVNACRAVDGLPMTLAKRITFVRSQGLTASGQELVRIHGKPEMHEGMVRLDGGGTADIRFRAIYRQWSIKLEIEYLRNIVSAEQIANLIELAGFIEGLCEHRPGAPKNNTGNNGRFSIRKPG